MNGKETHKIENIIIKIKIKIKIKPYVGEWTAIFRPIRFE